jgi:monoamine oxidase
LPALLQGGFGRFLASEYVFDWQMMMFQVVGGMDRLAQAFEQRVRPAITSGAEVQEIRQETQGVRVVYRDDGGRSQQVTADYGVCTIPLSVLRRIPADFTPEMTRAIAGIAYAPSCKVGLQFRRRFWEEDDHIFSGITHTNQSIGQILYPSYGYLGRKGLLVGCYNFGAAAAQMSKQAPARRIADALAQGTKIHPQYAQEYETGFSIAWRNVPYSLGGWAGYTDETRRDLYPALNRPDGRWLLAGEHMSYLTGWMAGAFESARVAVTAVHERVSAPL